MEENREINVEELANSLVDKNGNHIDLNELAGAYESVSALKKFLNHYTSYSKNEIEELAHFIDGLSGNDYGFREAASVRKKLEKNGFKKPYTPTEYKFKSHSEHFDEEKKEQAQEDEHYDNPGERYPIALVREKSPYPAINNVKIRVIVDGEEISELLAGERQVVSLPGGSHSVCFSQKNGNKEIADFYLGQNGVTVICSLISKWNGIFVQANVTNIFIDTIQNGKSREEKNSWWHQIPLLIRIVIWLVAIGFMLEFIFGVILGLSIGLA